jgi:CBS domain-containing protein
VRNPPVACPATATLREAAQKMADAKVRTIVVVNGAGAPVGMFTLVDLLTRVVLTDRSLHNAGGGDDVADRHSARVRHRVRSDARDGRTRDPADSSSSRTAGCSGVINERDLFALQRCRCGR